MSGFAIYVKAATKRRLIKAAEVNNRSLRAEVVLALLAAYRPPGWEATIADVLRRTKLLNNRAVTLDDGELETVGIIFPPGLREAVEAAAKAQRRSLNAEITLFLEKADE